MTASTAAPARTMIMIFLGTASPATSASSVSAPVIVLPSGRASTNSVVFAAVRL